MDAEGYQKQRGKGLLTIGLMAILGFILSRLIDSLLSAGYYLPIMLSYFFLCSMIVRYRNIRLKRIYDQEAREILTEYLLRNENDNNKKAPIFAVLLRGFTLDRFLIAERMSKPLQYLGAYAFMLSDRGAGKAQSLESQLSTVFREPETYFPLVAIPNPSDGPPEIEGSGKIILGEDWKPKILKLLEDSRLIVAFPWESTSTLWEMERIIENRSLLDKCIVVFPDAEPLRELSSGELKKFFGLRKLVNEATSHTLIQHLMQTEEILGRGYAMRGSSVLRNRSRARTNQELSAAIQNISVLLTLPIRDISLLDSYHLDNLGVEII